MQYTTMHEVSLLPQTLLYQQAQLQQVQVQVQVNK